MNFGLSSLLFSNAAMWAGAAALGLPVLIHLLTRRTPRRLIFPTLRFIKKADANQSALFRVRHWILLVVRTLLVLLILLAFLRPVLHAGAPLASTNKNARRAAVVVFDVSASMGYSGAGVTPLSRGRLAAEKVVGSLGGRDTANLILAAATPKGSFDAPSDNRFHLRNDLQNAALTQERADLDAAIAEAVRQLQDARGAQRELHLISDFQRSNWSAVNFAAIPKNVKIFFIPVGEARAANLAVTEVVLQPPAPAVGEAVEVICKAANYGPTAARAALQLRFGEAAPLTRELALEPGMVGTAHFRIRARKSGQYEGTVGFATGGAFGGDGLPLDDRRFFTLPVTEQVRVLVVSDEASADPRAGHRFLMRAINPYDDTRRGAVAASLARSAELNALALSRAQLVVFCGVGELSDKAVGLVLDYLKGGGGVVCYLDGPADARNLQALAKAAGDGFTLPFEIHAQRDRAPKDEFAALAEANFDHPLLRRFKESGELGALRFQRYFATTRNKQQGRVFLRFDDGNVALAEHSVGAGSLLICNFAFGLNHSDFAKHPLFVPFVHETIKSQRPSSSGGRTFEVGAPCATTVAGVGKNEPLRFESPAGARLEAGLDMAGEEAVVFFSRTEECGFYRVFRKDEALGAAAVNLNALESNLETLAEPQLRELAALSRDKYFAAADGAGLTSLQRLIEGLPLWHFFLLGALGMLGVEQLLGMWWKR